MFAKAAIALHNYLITTESSLYFPPRFVDGEDGAGNIIEGSWREEEPNGFIRNRMLVIIIYACHCVLLNTPNQLLI